MDVSPETLIGTSYSKRYFTGIPEDNYVIYDPDRGGLVVRSILGGPYDTIMLAEQECPDQESSDSDSGSFSFSTSASVSVSASVSASASISESVVISYDGVCRYYRVTNFGGLPFCCSDSGIISDFPGFNDVIEKFSAEAWAGYFDDGLGHGYDIVMNRVTGPVEIAGVIYGEDGEDVFILQSTCYGEYVNTLWLGVAVGTPLDEFVPANEAHCNIDYGSLYLECYGESSSDSGSFSI